jgi:hypothetical protein
MLNEQNTKATRQTEKIQEEAPHLIEIGTQYWFEQPEALAPPVLSTEAEASSLISRFFYQVLSSIIYQVTVRELEFSSVWSEN